MSEAFIKLSIDFNILDMVFVSCEDINIAENARNFEVILILKVGAVAPFYNDNANSVFAVNKLFGYIEFAC